MARYDRAILRGKPLDEDCKRAKISKHEFGLNDKRCYCYGLFAPNTIYELHPKCQKCGAYCMNAKPQEEKNKSQGGNNNGKQS